MQNSLELFALFEYTGDSNDMHKNYSNVHYGLWYWGKGVKKEVKNKITKVKSIYRMENITNLAANISYVSF